MKVYSIYCSDKYGYWTTKDLQCGTKLRKALLSNSIEKSPIKNLEIVQDEKWGDIAPIEISCVSISLNTKAQAVFSPEINCVPIAGHQGYYMALPPIIDALNLEKSVTVTFPNSNRIMAIRKYVFDINKIKNLSLFFLPYGPVSVFVTENFWEKYNIHDFTGIEFRNIYEEI